MAVLLGRNPGDSLSIRVAGYQFPEAEDPGKRFSWHIVEGEARCLQGAWSFRWQALTCDESPLLSAWLRETAAAQECQVSSPRAPLSFTEPNLSFRVGRLTLDAIVIDVDLDLEFQPPWHRLPYAGEPFMLSLVTDAEQLREAADEWDHERGPFPDGP